LGVLDKNKTFLITDKELSELARLFNEIKKDESNVATAIRDTARDLYVENEIKRFNKEEDFTAECWTLAVLVKLADLKYKIVKDET
jgi:hypothetical protein